MLMSIESKKLPAHALAIHSRFIVFRANKEFKFSIQSLHFQMHIKETFSAKKSKSVSLKLGPLGKVKSLFPRNCNEIGNFPSNKSSHKKPCKTLFLSIIAMKARGWGIQQCNLGIFNSSKTCSSNRTVPSSIP